MSEQTIQVWIRNDKGQVYGPLTPPSVELLIDNGVIGGRMQVSTNGENYVFPGRVPGLRMIFPRELWGETIVPGDELDAEWGKVVLPAAIAATGPASAPSAVNAAPSGGPVRGPGNPVGGPMAGPGVRGPVPARQPMGSRPSGVARPVGQVMTPQNAVAPAPAAAAIRSSPSMMDFMNTATGTAPPPAAVPAPVRSSPSVAEIMNQQPNTPPPPTRPAPPVMSPSTSSPSQIAPPRASSSGLRAAAAPSLPLEQLGMPASGSIGNPPSAHLYYVAAAKELTGLLTLTLADRELSVHFRKGNPEFIDSTHTEDSLDTFLVAQKLATPQQIAQAQEQAPRFGGDLLPALFGLGLLNPNAVFQHLGQRALVLLSRALTAEQGSFAFDLEDLAPSRAMPLGNKWSLYLDAHRKTSGPDVRRRQMNALELPVMKASGRVPVTEIRLTPQETRAYNHFDGARSLLQLVGDLPSEADVLMRVAWMLQPLELVSFAGLTQAAQAAQAKRPSAPPPRPPGPPVVAAPQRPGPPVMTPQQPIAPPKPVIAAAPVAPPPPPATGYPGSSPSRAPPVMAPRAVPASKPAAPAAPPEDAKQLRALYEQLKKGTYFDVLNLKRDADANQVKIAYLKAARSYHPDTIPPGAPEELAKVKADLFALIGEANRTLSDMSLRADYVGELEAGGTGSKIDIEKLLKGEELFQKGRIFVQARKYPDAFKLFEEAISCNGDEPEFFAWRGYSRFLMSADKRQVTNEVMKDLKLCIERNPNVAAAHYFMGYVIKTNGDPKAALVHFRRCVALDPKHIDAARELRPGK